MELKEIGPGELDSINPAQDRVQWLACENGNKLSLGFTKGGEYLD
jgi:hypothetical protein